ncbi:MAG: phenylalanine--tRNA ligase subunit alpha [Candidatus Izemoplasmataceae bacterium]
MDVKKRIQALEEELREALKEVSNQTELQDVKSRFLGKKAEISTMMKHMKDLPNEEKPAFGQAVNEGKQAFYALIEEKREVLKEKALNERLKKERIDVTLDAPDYSLGTTHVLHQIIEEIEDFFIGMGYLIKEGPEIETDEMNFEKLNLPKDHPARDMQDTFYITDETLLRTHTSPVQVRTMLEYGGEKPVKIICPGTVYRRDDDDATHSHQFTQIEGLVVDKDTTMSDLKGTLLALSRKLFGANREIRLRPSYFPFTEPSVEVDVTCAACGGEGCNICKQTGYIEILGAGMVNNHVLEASGYDPSQYQGFAFGLGIERIAMLKYGIEDIRHFYTNDLRFNKQFK